MTKNTIINAATDSFYFTTAYSGSDIKYTWNADRQVVSWETSLGDHEESSRFSAESVQKYVEMSIWKVLGKVEEVTVRCEVKTVNPSKDSFYFLVGMKGQDKTVYKWDAESQTVTWKHLFDPTKSHSTTYQVQHVRNFLRSGGWKIVSF